VGGPNLSIVPIPKRPISQDGRRESEQGYRTEVCKTHGGSALGFLVRGVGGGGDVVGNLKHKFVE